ncbi:uncharacterized protein IL334_007085 [Kwoniella shivajii]|uniref:Uncharacterized protein n=1 Tax=Kwoniella shivajii TaxID=564305 RepID=A0ABZ1D7Q3_9TREE|nr:hypothetical protein IL334_007085 [Kwoniella shivajii]
MTMAAQSVDPAQPFVLPSSPFYTPSRKRAASPPSPTTTPQAQQPHTAPSPWTSNGRSSPPEESSYHHSKRRRPNLANGFQSLSISIEQANRVPIDPDQLLDHADQATEKDEGIGLTRSANNDVRVEVLPDERSSKRHHHHSTTHHWSIPTRAGPSSSSSSSTSPTTSGEENHDSDTTFTYPFQRRRRYAGVAQQADEIVQPDQPETFGSNAELGVEDVTTHIPRSGRRSREHDSDASMEIEPKGKRVKREGEMDMDMDDVPSIVMNEVDKRRKRKTIWHEPEKDRIVITCLSDTSSSRASSRSPSPEEKDIEESYLSQPGMQGFTLSPSLLTHLLKTQRDRLNAKFPHTGDQSSLVVYRPLGIPPGDWNESAVRNWQPDKEYVDSGRFQEVDDDENYDKPESMHMAEDEPMDMDGDVQMD